MRIERREGVADQFVMLPWPDPLTEVEVRAYALRRPALVLGSSQRDNVVDTVAAAEARVDVVRRRSGGGAVFLEPDRSLWIDVFLPRTDDRWVDDIGLAGHWLGEVWAETLTSLGVDVDVYRDRLQKTTWGSLVCFAALGPGEVTAGGSKVVGVAQRRTRTGALFQCLVLDEWDPRRVVDLLALSEQERERACADTARAAVGAGVPLPVVHDAFLSRIGAERP